ncbi:MAG: CsgG/HfaB family protein [Candidatus Firestonebacteria bacterium]
MVRKIVIIGIAGFLIGGCGTATRVTKEDVMSVKQTEKVESKYTGPKRRIAVIDFETKEGYAKRLGTTASSILMTEVGKSGKFILIEREKINKLLEEQKLGQTGIIDSNTAVSVGRILGLNALITGCVSQFGVNTESSHALIAQSKRQIAEATVDIRIIDATNGRVLYVDSGSGKAEKSTGTFLGMGSSSGYDERIEGDALRASIVKVIENIIYQINKTPFTCRVADLESEKLYLDAGKESGLQTGMNLTVYKLGREITSPTTGLVIGRVEEKCGVIQIIDFFGEDGSMANIVSGKAGKGDLCKLNE